MKKYVVRDYTMEQAGFGQTYTSDYFDTYEEALKEMEQREYADKVLGIFDEYYIEEIEVND